MPVTALIHAEIILPHERVKDKALLIDGAHILGLGNLPDADCAVIDLEGCLVAPGFVDIHTHGALGRAFNEASHEAIDVIARRNVESGVTSILPTLATAPIPDLANAVRALRDWMQAPHPGHSQILGVHLEGPYLNPAQAGAQDVAAMRLPNDGSPEALLSFSESIKMMTLAPELPGAIDLIERLVSRGILPAAGHSAALDTDVDRAVAHGLKHCIHLWSSQSTTVRVGPWRKPGLLEASLVSDVLTGEIIADNKHLPPTLMRLAYKCLGPDRLCAVSDATPAAGLPDGSIFTMGGLSYTVVDSVGMTLDRLSFAGSATLLGDMLPILVFEVGLPLCDAIRMMSTTPARIISVRKGTIEPGADADLVVLDPTLRVYRTMIGGQWAFIRPVSR